MAKPMEVNAGNHNFNEVLRNYMTREDLQLNSLIDDIMNILKWFGLIHSRAGVAHNPKWKALGALVNLYFWAWTFRITLLYANQKDIKFSLYLLDITVFWTGERDFYLITDFCYGLVGSLITLHFFLAMGSNSWINKFVRLWEETSYNIESINHSIGYNSKLKQYQHVKVYGFRLFLVFLATIIGIIAANFDKIRSERQLWELIIATVFFQQFSYSILLFSSIFFILICLCCRQRFEEVYYNLLMIYEDFNRNNIDEETYFKKLALLKRKHYKSCEMVKIGNGFWSFWLGAVSIILTPFAFFATYEVIFVKNEQQLTLTIAWFGFSSWVILAFISVNAAMVAGISRKPKDVLYKMTLYRDFQFDTKLQLKDFIQLLNGPSIGFACFDLMVITQPQIYSVCVALISYFLIVIDMRSRHEFDHFCTLANGTIISDIIFRENINETLQTLLSDE